MILGGEISATESAAPTTSPTPVMEFDASAPRAIDIVVRWGDWVVATHELSPPRPFVVGEHACDVTLPAAVLGADRVPILLTRWDGNVRLIVPSMARVLLGGQKKRMSAARCIARSLGQASTEVPGGAEVELLPGQTYRLFFAGVTVDVHLGVAAPRMPRRALVDKRMALIQFASLGVHLFLLFLLFFFQPPRDPDADEGITDDQKFTLQQYLNRAAEYDWDYMAEVREGYKRRARRNERRLIAALAAQQDAWMDAIENGRMGWTDELARAAARDEAPRGSNQGTLGVLYDWPTPEPTTRSVTTTSRDTRPMAAVTLPADTSPGRGYGPRLRAGAVSVSGRLPPEVIQRIVRQNFGRFRLCYENGLRNNPNLIGRVAVRFVIGRDGAVSNVGNGGSDMPDGGVVSCVVRAFHGLSFPEPESGIVTVVYPIMFAPGG